jgi:hypothetical protein
MSPLSQQRSWRSVALAVAAAAAFALPTVRAASAQQAAVTLDDVLTSLRRGADTLDLARVSPAQDRALDSVSAMFRAAGVTSLTIDALAEIITKNRASFSDVARWSPHARTAWTEPWFYDALVRLRRIANAAGTGISPRLVAAFGSSVADHFIAPMDELETKILRRAEAKNAEKLRRYELKYGPESARLNIAEVVINYLAERPGWSPFAPGEDGPSAFELVSAYSTSELTASRSPSDKLQPHVLAAAHAGLRFYRFNERRIGGNRFQNFIAPKYIGAGAFFLGASDRVLISPFETGRRSGVFLDWGATRAGVTFGHDWRAVLGVGKQILPYLF